MTGHGLTDEAFQKIKAAAVERARQWPDLTPEQIRAMAGPMEVGLPAARDDDEPAA